MCRSTRPTVNQHDRKQDMPQLKREKGLWKNMRNKFSPFPFKILFLQHTLFYYNQHHFSAQVFPVYWSKKPDSVCTGFCTQQINLYVLLPKFGITRKKPWKVIYILSLNFDSKKVEVYSFLLIFCSDCWNCIFLFSWILKTVTLV